MDSIVAWKPDLTHLYLYDSEIKLSNVLQISSDGRNNCLLMKLFPVLLRLILELRTKIFVTGAPGKMNRGEPKDEKDSTGRYYLLRDEEETRYGIYDRPLPCFGCGIGWFSFLTGFLCPVMWYYATILYFGNYYRKDPRERGGLAASAVAALICTVAAFITILVIFL